MGVAQVVQEVSEVVGYVAKEHQLEASKVFEPIAGYSPVVYVHLFLCVESLSYFVMNLRSRAL